jgi:uncharacterized protein with FMN-binding domain
MSKGGSNKKVANKLVAASCATVLAVYTAGYARTQSAANRIATQIAAERRASNPTPQRGVIPFTEIATTPGVPPEALSQVATSKPNRDPSTEPRPVAIEESAPAQIAPATSAAVEPSPIETQEPVSPAPQVTTSVTTSAAAPVAMPAPAAVVPAQAAPAWKDGVYTGWGYSRHGNIEAAVVVERGRIASATISQCRTRYSCSVIDKLPPQVAQRQSPEVDYVSGATQSADAFYGAVVEALSKAK